MVWVTRYVYFIHAAKACRTAHFIHSVKAMVYSGVGSQEGMKATCSDLTLGTYWLGQTLLYSILQYNSVQLITLHSKLYLISFLIFRTRHIYTISYPLLFAKAFFFSSKVFLSFQLEEKYCIFNKYKRLTILLPLKHASHSSMWTSILPNLLRLLMFYSSASHCGRNAIKIIVLCSLLTTMAKHFHSH